METALENRKCKNSIGGWNSNGSSSSAKKKKTRAERYKNKIC